MKKKILIIDDDPRNIFALSATLRAKGYDCVSCAGAREAIKLLEGEAGIDAILIDMMMPEMDGYEAIPLIKAMPKMQGIPVISVTAQAMVGDREKCLDAGADGYISKPIDVDRLLQMLERI
ncbi:response regulator [Flavobacterium sp. MFBS3-15]|uniref:response regulator n=1 Tax=Flavobacterium sp. MFBS3-15 TaxID=2989816 RepID=UPI0022369C77|nr:response regulator [Flavobacterium sp. MFBS3-15]MCW4470586.1 response regulator [Flavobacterium sp. MFBS3-15]